MGKQKQKSKALEQMNEKCYLLKVVAEQNRERILDYDVDQDTVKIYCIVDGQFKTLHEVPDYIKGDGFGKYFIDPEDIDNYRKALEVCLTEPCSQLVDVRYHDKGAKNEWYRAYLNSLTDDKGEIVRIVGRLMSVQKDKMANEKIQRRAEIDALTNVYNHKAFEEKCEKELAKGKANAIFLMMDVDDFKLINDTQGHNVGDLVLSQTGAILNEAVSGHGFAGRLGGDEFAVFVWDLGSIDEMRAFVSQLRDNLKTIIFDMEYSASIGVGVLDSDAPLTFKDMYFKADQAVYAAKHHGKNQIVFYEDIDEKAADETEEVLIEDPAEMAEDADERAILTQLKECLDYFSIEPYNEAMMHVKQALSVFYDADVVTVVALAGENACVATEYHKESADMMAKLIVSEVEQNRAKAFAELLGEKEDIYVHNLKSIRESNTKLYTHFADKRIWSVMLARLFDGGQSIGMIQVINPRKHTADSALIHMLGEYLSVRVLLNRAQENVQS